MLFLHQLAQATPVNFLFYCPQADLALLAKQFMAFIRSFSFYRASMTSTWHQTGLTQVCLFPKKKNQGLERW
jgi:hypothetical protein